MRNLLIILAFASQPAWADDICHDWWFTRNAIMDRAGYCFGSALGKAVFDNSDCTGKTVQLTRKTIAFVNRIKAEEARFGCKVNTAQPVLDLDDLETRRRLTDFPLRDEFESACLGWLGAAVPLYASYRPGAAQIGRLMPGDYVSFAFWPEGDWAYLTIHAPDWTLKSGGWSDVGFPEDSCRGFAG